MINDTAALRNKILAIWTKVDKGTMPPAEARIHIGLARTVLDTLKVEIAAAHLKGNQLPAPVELSSKPRRLSQ